MGCEKIVSVISGLAFILYFSLFHTHTHTHTPHTYVHILFLRHLPLQRGHLGWYFVQQASVAYFISCHDPTLYCRRMNYTDAIQYLKEHNIMKEDGSPFEFGDVSFY